MILLIDDWVARLNQQAVALESATIESVREGIEDQLARSLERLGLETLDVCDDIAVLGYDRLELLAATDLDGAVLTFVDITATKELEAHLRR